MLMDFCGVSFSPDAERMSLKYTCGYGYEMVSVCFTQDFTAWQASGQKDNARHGQKSKDMGKLKCQWVWEVAVIKGKTHSHTQTAGVQKKKKEKKNNKKKKCSTKNRKITKRHFNIRPLNFPSLCPLGWISFCYTCSSTLFSFPSLLVDICKYECSRAIITKMLHTQIIPK